jgi:hypothetical protein
MIWPEGRIHGMTGRTLYSTGFQQLHFLNWISVATSLHSTEFQQLHPYFAGFATHMLLLLVPFLIWRDPSTIRAETSNTKPTSFYFGHGFNSWSRPIYAHVINYIIPAKVSTRGRPFFNYFRAQVHASKRCLQSKVAPFQQPFIEANVRGGPGPFAGSDGPGCDAAALHAIPCIRPTRLEGSVLHFIYLLPLSWQWHINVIKCFQFFKFHWVLQ